MEWQFSAGDRKCGSLAQASGLSFSDANSDGDVHADSDCHRHVYPDRDRYVYSDGHCDVYPDAHCDSDSNGNCSCNRKRLWDGNLLLKSGSSPNPECDNELYRNYQWFRPNGWFG